MSKLFIRLLFVSATLGLGMGFGVAAHADDVIRIEVGKNPDRYSNDELRRRVWKLERAVAQLQERIYDLEAKKDVPPPVAEKPWTCRIQSFNTTYRATESTRGAALAKALEQCSEGSSAIHCNERDVKCDN